MAATNLYQYYTGMGQPLPSQSTLGGMYSKYGLGSGYAGTAQQNTALLGKIQGGVAAPAAPVAPTGNAAGGYGGTSSGGYNQTPVGQPQPIASDPGINEMTTFASTNAASRQALVDKLNAELSGAYDRAAGETGMTAAADAMNAIRGNLTSASATANNTPIQVNENTKGTFQNDGQRAEEIQTELIPQQANIANLGLALAPAEYAYQTSQQATQQKVQLLMESQNRQLTGFDTNAQTELAAIQAKVARGEALTDQEFQRETQLAVAQKQYEAAQAQAGATVSAANISAGASTANTASTNAASVANTATGSSTALKLGALQYPGINVTPGANGTYSGALPGYMNFGPSQPPAASTAITPQAIANAAGKYFK